MAKLEVRDESLRASHRSGAVNGHDECKMQHGCFEQRSNDRSEEGQECKVVLHLDHVMHGSSGSHRKCIARVKHGGVATSLSSAFTQEHCKVLSFPVDTNDVVNLQDTMDRKIK